MSYCVREHFIPNRMHLWKLR